MRLSAVDLKEMWDEAVEETLQQGDFNAHQTKQVKKHAQAFLRSSIKVEAISCDEEQRVPQPDVKKLASLKRKLEKTRALLEQERASCLEQVQQGTKRKLAKMYPPENRVYEAAVAPEAAPSHDKMDLIYKDDQLVGHAQAVVDMIATIPQQLVETLNKTRNWLETGPLSESTIIQE